jgi:DNA-binding response OmpR family regulator
MQPVRVLLVEDDQQIQKSLNIGLSFSGYQVETADTLAKACSSLKNSHYDILLLDVGLPDGTGIEFCEKIRGMGMGVPVVFLSARTDEPTVVQGLNSGGDDYLRKPFGIEELKARMNRVLNKPREQSDLLTAGPLAIDLKKRVATVSSRYLNVGRREFDILVTLTRRPGDVVTREQILAQLEEKSEVYDRTIDSHMSHLRKKIREIAGENLQIAAVYGVGYRLHWSTGT